MRTRGLASGYRAGAICNRDCRGAVVAELDGRRERERRRIRTERMWTGVCTTISKSFRFPDCGSTATSSPRSTRKMILSMCETERLLRRFLFVMWRTVSDFGSWRSLRIVHGPGPMKPDTTSPRSSAGSTTSASGDCRNASGSSELSGRSGGPSFLGCLRARRETRFSGSVRAMRRKPAQ